MGGREWGVWKKIIYLFIVLSVNIECEELNRILFFRCLNLVEGSGR